MALRQQVVHYGEDRLFDLAGILRAADQHSLLAQIDHNKDFGAGAIVFWDCMKIGRVEDGKLRHMGR